VARTLPLPGAKFLKGEAMSLLDRNPDERDDDLREAREEFEKQADWVKDQNERIKAVLSRELQEDAKNLKGETTMDKHECTADCEYGCIALKPSMPRGFEKILTDRFFQEVLRLRRKARQIAERIVLERHEEECRIELEKLWQTTELGS